MGHNHDMIGHQRLAPAFEAHGFFPNPALTRFMRYLYSLIFQHLMTKSGQF